MTFTETGEVIAMEKLEKKCMSTGELLQECLWQAVDQHRLTSGVFECAKFLHRNAENVMLVILPEAKNENLSVHIQHTLIEAICWENDIRILKVKNSLNLSKSLTAFKNGVELRSIPEDTSCMLIEYPEIMSREEELMSDFYEEMLFSDVYPKPVIELPV